MMITPIEAFKDNYIWMLTAEKNAVIVDPGDAAPVLTVLKQQQLTLTAILITHHHWDHTNGVQQLLQQYRVPVFGPARDNLTILTHPLNDNDTVICPGLNLDLQVLDIPGHTKGHIAYTGHDILFSGDTLFTAGCGRLFEGTASQLYHSLMRLAALPTDTKVYCGHEYTESNLLFALAVEPDNKDIQRRLAIVRQLRQEKLSTVSATLTEEKKTNPFLRCHIPAVIQAAEQQVGRTLRDPIEIFAILRQWKDNFSRA